MFNTFKIFADFEANTGSINSWNTRPDDDKNKNSVDVRYFGLFIALQLFIQKTKGSISIDTRDKINWQVSEL